MKASLILIPIVVIASLGFIVYSNTLESPFEFDDMEYINPIFHL